MQNPIGGVQVSGNKITFEADVAYTFPALFSILELRFSLQPYIRH